MEAGVERGEGSPARSSPSGPEGSSVPSLSRSSLLLGGVTREADRCPWEHFLNVATCAPYFWLARCVPAGLGPWVRAYRWLIASTACSATAYHAVQGGSLRGPLRRLDYTAVALSSSAFVCAALPKGLHPLARPAAGLASLLVVPFQPLLVSGANMVATNALFLRAAILDSTLKGQYYRHCSYAAVGLACYFLDDELPDTAGLHAVWHVLSARAVFLGHCLLGA